MNTVVFNAGKITEKSGEVFQKLIAVFEQNGLPEKAAELREQLNAFKEDESIRVAFIGQFSSGKSSIISALTGNKEIKIGSDVTTDKSESYLWGSFWLTDTPGLQNNEKHDAIAEEALLRSDLIVYCITSELFSKNTLEDFKSLAFEKGYKGKMVLVINRLNSEFTEDVDALIATYEQQIEKDLAPYSLLEIPHCFIDAKDYLDGTKDQDEELIAESRFDRFTDFLNTFLREKGLICKLSTPILTANRFIDDAMIDASDTEDEQKRRIALSRLSRVVNHQKVKASRSWENIITEDMFSFIHQGYALTNRLGEADFDFDLEIKEIANETNKKIASDLEAFVTECDAQLREELDEVFESQVGQYLLHTISSDSGSALETEKKGKAHTNDELVRKLGKTGTEIASRIKVNPQTMYNIVEKVGHKVLKIKFKPWGITKTAEKLGGALGKGIKALGPIGDVVNLAMEIKSTVDESNEAKELLELRKKAKQYVKEIAEEIRQGYYDQKEDFLNEIYGAVASAIEQEDQAVAGAYDGSKAFQTALEQIKAELNALLAEVMRS